jgi:NAD(P)-dependent dehydrogenase (short-subunit alcohol dehydrogenase family)
MGTSRLTLARSKSVVTTGASSRLGRAAAIHLRELGYRVFAGVRTESSAAELSAMSPSTGKLIPVMVDVTDTRSIAQVGERVEHASSDAGRGPSLTMRVCRSARCSNAFRWMSFVPSWKLTLLAHLQSHSAFLEGKVATQ